MPVYLRNPELDLYVMRIRRRDLVIQLQGVVEVVREKNVLSQGPLDAAVFRIHA